MLRQEVEDKIASVSAWGALAVALLVTDRVSTEPVNVGKMTLLVCLSFATFSLVIQKFKSYILENKSLCISVLGFLIFGLLSIFISSNAWVKGFYGTFGRNTGFLTYLSLALLFLSFSMLRERKSFQKLIKSLMFAGYINIVLSLLELRGIEIFTWNNPYGNLLGTFGNPDFISAFMGIFVSALFAKIFQPKIDLKNRFLIFCFICLGILVILETKALQGLIVVSVGLSIVFFFFLSSYFGNKLVNFTYLLVVASSALLGLLGTLQKGPLQSILYKPSVSFRGEYWAAGIRMGLDHLVTGVGLDSYGTFYRYYRDASAMVSPGRNVVTDTSHNVFIDIFAGIGIFGFIFYLGIWIVVLQSAFKVMKKQKEYDVIFVTLIVIWFGYQIQSAVSINQIGLAIWGWLIGGAIVAYSRCNLDTSKIEQKVNVRKKSLNNSQNLLPASAALNIAIFAGVGLLVSLPPFIADAKMRTAFSSKDANKVTEAAKAWPLDSLRLNRAAVELANAGITSNALEISSIATKTFPQDFVGWYTIYELTPSVDKKKDVLKEKLHSLDPLNPDFK